MGLEQVELITNFGVDARHFTVGHMDRNPDMYTHLKIAETGAYLQYDTPSRVKYFPESTFVDLLRGMIDAGYGKQILWGGDLARKSYFISYGGGPGLAYVPGKFARRLSEQGFDDEILDDLFIHNPARALAFAV